MRFFKNRANKNKRIVILPKGSIFIVRVNERTSLSDSLDLFRPKKASLLPGIPPSKVAIPYDGFFALDLLHRYAKDGNYKIDYKCTTNLDRKIEASEYKEGTYLEDAGAVKYEGFFCRPTTGMGRMDGSYCFFVSQDGIEVLPWDHAEKGLSFATDTPDVNLGLSLV